MKGTNRGIFGVPVRLQQQLELLAIGQILHTRNLLTITCNHVMLSDLGCAAWQQQRSLYITALCYHIEHREADKLSSMQGR